MKCPFCSHVETQVMETRMSDEGDSVRRRRSCSHCEKRFTTYERADVSYPAVVKKDGRRIDYDRQKLRGSLNLALRKRPVSTEQIDAAIERIEEKLLTLSQREVASTRIGELVMREGQTHTWCRWPIQVEPVLPGAWPMLHALARAQGWKAPLHQNQPQSSTSNEMSS